jgi:hypothetical protein
MNKKKMNIQLSYIKTLEKASNELEELIDIFKCIYQFNVTQFIIPFIREKIQEYLKLNKEFGINASELFLSLEELQLLHRVCKVFFPETSLPFALTLYIRDLQIFLYEGRKVMKMPLNIVVLDKIICRIKNHMLENPIGDIHRLFHERIRHFDQTDLL